MKSGYNQLTGVALAETRQQALAKEMADVALTRPNTPRNLHPETDRRQYKDTVAQEPLVGKKTHGGVIEQGISHFIVVGETVLAVSREVNLRRLQQQGSARDTVERIRLSVLPFGAQAEAGTSQTILDIDPRAMNHPRGDGVVQRWQSVVIGREGLTNLTRHEDGTASRQHCRVTVDADGALAVENASANGTQIYTLDDLRDPTSMSDGGRATLSEVVGELQQHSYMWESESAGRRVVLPS